MTETTFSASTGPIWKWTGGDFLKTAALAVIAATGYALLAYLCVEFPRNYDQVAPIWLSNGFGVACLLSCRNRHWPAVLLGCLVGGLAAGAHVGDLATVNIVLVSCNIMQIFACAWGMRRICGPEIDLGRARDMIAFALICGLAAPIATGVVAATIHTAMRGGALLANIGVWSLGDILGLMTITPCLLALVRVRRYLRERPLSISGVGSLVLLLAVTVYVFTQSRPLLFIVPPVMLVVAWRLEVLGAALSATLVAVVAVIFTMAGHGPITLLRTGSSDQAIVLQLFLATAIFISLPVASIQRHRRQMLQSMTEANAAMVRSEARFRQLAENAQDMIIHSNMRGIIQYASPGCLQMTGFAAEELVGREGMFIVHQDDRDAVRAIVVEQLAQLADHHDAGPRRIEYRALRKDGQMIWLESRPGLQHDPLTGKATGITDIVRDVTEQKAMERQLREARNEAEAAAAVKGEFLANMSHELRTPLTSVLGFARLVDDEPDLSPDARRFIGRVLSGGKALLTTINDILDFSKLEAGQLELKLEPVAPASLIEEALDLFSLETEARGVALRTEGLEDLPADLLIDGGRLRQVLLNLIGNAAKFTEAGSITVTAAYDDAAERLSVSVLDTGPGIATEDVDLLFRRFSQVDAGLTRKHGGTGLGLAICKGLVEAMGGQIGVVSVPGHGACFSFDVVAPSTAQAEASSAQEAAPPLLPPACRVLVVDDNPANRELVNAILTAMGAEVAEAVDGEEGVAAAAARPFDAILMDLRMPRLDGAQAALRIRGEGGPNAATPIIAFSADARPGGPGGIFDGAVSKPMTVAGLIDALNTAMASTPARTLEASA
ncbi:histidine kinase [Caulobacter sp. Root1455]|uniref:MASE1 domain-containing protein n=1 Tax=Caulobacter sp. Root1455 TaxID=1736465 RepID=UPI0006F3BCF7|nr:MASE1 domain-containing protein [Caulobacter sp. Root1455]KQY99024.1 histidine kinase [Caulobacter sp. Root1455]